MSRAAPDDSARAACARRLARLLTFGGSPGGGEPPSVETPCTGDPEALSVLAARDGSRTDDRMVAATVRRTTAACEFAARWQAALGERGITALPLGGVAHMGRLYGSPGERLVERVSLLVSPYDAARARVVLASGGLERTAEHRWHGAVFRSGDLPLELRWGFHPPGWSSFPSSPFFEGAADAEAPYLPMMPTAGASWAVHRLILASELWRPARWRPLELAETAALGARVPEVERYRWGGLVRRWGGWRLWRRADELEVWLLGGPLPRWFAELVEGAAAPASGLADVLRLQDGPMRALAALPRWLLARILHE